jgi:putative oxidoreductase
MAFLAVLAEFFGGLGLIAGLLGRVAAVGIAVVMVSAIVMVNGRYGLFLDWFGDRKGHGYEYHLLAIALAAVIVVRGSGAMSLDRLLYISLN